MIARSAVSAVSIGTPWTLAVAAIARSIARRRGCAPRSATAAARRPLTGYGSVDGERLEGRLDHAESLGPARALVGIAREERSEVQWPATPR